MSDEFVDEIIDTANTEPCYVSNNGEHREFEFDKSAEGCTFLELETQQGNFFTIYCQCINKLIERTVLPEIEHHLTT